MIDGAECTAQVFCIFHGDQILSVKNVLFLLYHRWRGSALWFRARERSRRQIRTAPDIPMSPRAADGTGGAVPSARSHLHDAERICLRDLSLARNQSAGGT